MTTAKGKGLLRLETQQNRLLFEGKVVPAVKGKFLYLYGLLIYKELVLQISNLSNQLVYVPVDLQSLAQLPTWSIHSDPVKKTQLAEHHEKMKAKPLLSWNPKEKTTQTFLNSKLVTRISVDLNVGDLRQWLGLKEEINNQDDTRAAIKLMLAQAMFEDGRYPDALEYCQKSLALVRSANSKIQIYALIAWIKTFTESAKVSWEAVQNLHEVLATSRSHEFIEPQIEARVWLQTARHHWRHLEWDKVEKTLNTAAKFLHTQHDIEWAGIHTGRGFIALHGQQWSVAKGHFYQAFQSAARAQWRWSIQAQATNLGSVCMEQIKDLKHEPLECTALLIEAKDWFEQALELVHEDDFGGAVDLETNLIIVYLELGELDLAKAYDRKARKILDANPNLVSQERAIYLFDTVKLPIHEKKWLTAEAQLEEALQIFEQLGMKNYIKKVKSELTHIRRNLRIQDREINSFTEIVTRQI